MKKNEIKQFIILQKQKKLDEVHNEINKINNTWARQHIEAIGFKETAESTLEVLKAVHERSEKLKTYFGGDNLMHHYVYETDENISRGITDVAFTTNDSMGRIMEKAISHLSGQAPSTQEIIDLKKRSNAIREEFTKIENTLKQYNTPKKQFDFLVGIGFNEEDILKFDESKKDNEVMVTEVNKDLVM